MDSSCRRLGMSRSFSGSRGQNDQPLLISEHNSWSGVAFSLSWASSLATLLLNNGIFCSNSQWAKHAVRYANGRNRHHAVAQKNSLCAQYFNPKNTICCRNHLVLNKHIHSLLLLLQLLIFVGLIFCEKKKVRPRTKIIRSLLFTLAPCGGAGEKRWRRRKDEPYA
jgi:hypothetical protein